MKKRILLTISLILLMALSFGCKEEKSMTLISWSDFVKWEDQAYERVLDVTVPEEKIGAELGAVIEQAPTEVKSPDYEPKNGQSGSLPAGTKLYEIVGYDRENYLAALSEGMYRLYKTSGSEDIDFWQDDRNSMDLPGAYFDVFQYFLAEDKESKQEIQYVAVETDGLTDTDEYELETLLKAFCDANSYALLFDEEFEDLAEKGYLKNGDFEHGVAVEFEEPAYQKDQLLIRARKVQDEIGKIFTMEQKESGWEMIEVREDWVACE